MTRTVGTSAYELDHFGALPELEVYEEYQRTADVQVRPRPQSRREVRRATRFRVPVFGILGTLVVGAMLILVILSHMELAMVSSEMGDLERQMSALRTENRYLLAAHEEAFAPGEVYQFAREELGMAEAARGQIVFIGSSIDGDVAEIIRVEEEQAIAGLIDHMAGLVWILRSNFGR